MGLRTRLERWIRHLTANPPEWPPPRDIYLSIAELRRRELEAFSTPTSLDLAPFELRVFSMNGEDGVLQEIIRRVGATSNSFIEFGTESGVEANCVYLADVAGWSGHFIEADATNHAAIELKYRSNPRVSTARAMVTPANVERLFAAAGIEKEFDVLSIDIDSHDYWVWEAITDYRPRVVVIEYNAALGVEPLVLPRDVSPSPMGIDYFGASIGALRKLATSKGYRHVYCDLCGVNAFFVRSDLSGDFLAEEDVQLRSANYSMRGIRFARGPGRYERV